MRRELLHQVAIAVNGYPLRLEVDYDYTSVRKRLIPEALAKGVRFVRHGAVEGNVAEFGTMWGFRAHTIARAAVLGHRFTIHTGR